MTIGKCLGKVGNMVFKTPVRNLLLQDLAYFPGDLVQCPAGGSVGDLVLVPLQHVIGSGAEVEEGLLDHPHHVPGGEGG